MPTLQNNPLFAHSRGNSDVQGKVAQFNNLSREAAQRRKDNEAALKRAVLGREEAEGESRRLREENRVLRNGAEELRARERRVGERLEGVMDELAREKEAQARAKEVYEREVRRARKEAFKSSSTLVNLQEELKLARNRYTLMRVEADEQKRKGDAEEQKTSAMQDRFVEVQGELETLRQQMRIVQAERDALKATLKDEEFANIAMQGAVALPVSPEGEFASPRKRARNFHRGSLKENIDPGATEVEDQLLTLKDELRTEKRLRLRADDQVHFMKMECQFQCCSCRVAERQGTEYVHDDSMAEQMSELAAVFAKEDEGLAASDFQIDPALTSQRSITPPARPSMIRQLTDHFLAFSPSSGTFYKAPSPAHPSLPHEQPSAIEEPSEAPREITLQCILSPQPLPLSRQTTLPDLSISQVLDQNPDHLSTSPNQPTPPFTFPLTLRPLPIPPPRTISHTTSVPLKSDDFFSPAPSTPGGISREEALEQIRQRRGRARSYAAANGGTPRKAAGLAELRRDISAPGKI
ncbi:hypothetical protein MMC21_002371 [Puttea exsequens]|nr:hypothetical protein [Puttea exsequens]